MGDKKFSEKSISKIRLFVLSVATTCFIIALFVSKVYQSVLVDVCLALLAIQFALRAAEIHMESKREDVKDEE